MELSYSQTLRAIASRKWRLLNPDKSKAASKNWRAKNKAKHNATSAAWRNAHSEYVKKLQNLCHPISYHESKGHLQRVLELKAEKKQLQSELQDRKRCPGFMAA